MTTVNPTVNDQLTKVQLRLLKQKLTDEKIRLDNDAQLGQKATLDGELGKKLEDALRYRQDLMEKIRHEQTLNDELHRSNSFRERKVLSARRVPSAKTRQESRCSRTQDRDRRSPRQIIEHQFRPIRLDPLETSTRAPPPPPHTICVDPPERQPEVIRVEQPARPQIIRVEQPENTQHVLRVEQLDKPQVIKVEHTDTTPRSPQILHAPPPQVVHAPHPYFPHPQPDTRPPINTKQEMMEMMMMQNAQMHQMMMQHMMMSALPKPPPPPNNNPSGVSLSLDDILSLKKSEGRPSSVHHHHYSQHQQHSSPQAPPPAQPPYYVLPPINVPPPVPNYYPPRQYPIEVEPLKQPRARRRRKPTRTPEYDTSRYFIYGKLPFPGPWALRKFRHVAYAAFFAVCLQRMIKRKRGSAKLHEDFIFEIRLKEAVAAIHHIYLNAEGKILGLLNQGIVDSSKDYSAVFHDSNDKDKQVAYDDLEHIVETVSYATTDIMPDSGVLGTHKKSVVYDMIKPGKLYPKGYLWQMEKDMMQFDSMGRTTNINDNHAALLMVGIYIGRALVTTLLRKPMEYGLTNNVLTYRAERNVKILVSIFIYILRKVYAPPKDKTPAPLPFELGMDTIHTDEEMESVYKKLNKSIEYAEGLLRTWSKEYVKRLMNATA